jgi:hypothetical protein
MAVILLRTDGTAVFVWFYVIYSYRLLRSGVRITEMFLNLWSTILLRRLALDLLSDERFVDVRDNTAAGDGSLDEGVQLFVTANGKLQVPGGDSLHLQVLRSVAGQLENLHNEEKIYISILACLKAYFYCH